eukprot:CAMPEP_0201488422 /NCGR_PEP_ID=MMETSP0151_2-20130828/18137_1 /ASSEMBLY_ACC=CAM_ASM_000257 /TAXON_ID=200890 /ORGANISM="Paramoeba atlantica, Strain 621/1 / CCAP 1560/9" /LENGTH=834 /DNA_ID=CAMNT_0047873709 /DNA_START=70 /DNA_END=2574 /DNA_ORIENTATION=+
MSDTEDIALEEEEEEVNDLDQQIVDLRDGLPPLAPSGDSYQDRLIFAKQRACLLLLLRAKAFLALQVSSAQDDLSKKIRSKDEEKTSDGVDPFRFLQDLQGILHKQAPGEDDEDLVKIIQELKQQLVIELRKNHALDRKLAKLDKRIALLIKNRGNVQMLMSKMKKGDDKGPRARREVREIKLTSKSIETYQDMFYLLQTEPRYLARVVYLVSPDQMESFLETTILTLYGDAFSPREEFLVLKLFQLAMQHEISVIQHASDFLQSETVVPKMIVTYNRRKQGMAYIQRVLGPVMNSVLEEERNMELNPLTIYVKMINEQEIRTGEKSKLERQVTPEQALKNPEVSQIVDARLKELADICRMFVNAILQSVSELPYGLRWICKSLSNICKTSLPESNDLENQKLIGYFVYYRFLNLAIVAPDSQQAQLVKKELSALARKSCVVISKVLQTLFNLRSFAEDNKPETLALMRLNPFMEEYLPKVTAYFDALVKVDDPEDHLQVNKYMELTQKTKPMIQISLHEIFQTHQMVAQHLEKIAPEQDDPLRKVMAELGSAPEFVDLSEEEDREIQLTLTNRFKVDVEEETETEKRYAETKELLIPVLRKVPIKTSIQRLQLMDVLENGIRFAQENRNQELNSQINQILENMNLLAKEGVLTKEDNYESFLQDVAQDIINRNSIREQQKKEILRLQTTLKNLRLHQAFLEDQIKEYNGYLDDLLKTLYEAPKKKKAKKGQGSSSVGPFKFTYKDLEKRGVVIESGLDMIARKTTSFFISSDEPGIFDITAKVGKMEVEKIELRFDDLLERHYNNATRLELDQVVLDVNMTIHLINTLFMKKK